MRAAILILLATFPLTAAWRRAATAHFEIFTDRGDREARDLATGLEQLRAIFGQSASGAETPLPVRVFLFRSERDYDRIRPSPLTKAFFQGGPERDLIAVGPVGAETRRAVQHEFIHLVLNHSTAALPLWLEEGAAEFYSTLSVDGDLITLGQPIEAHPRTLAALGWLDADAFFSIGRGSRIHENARATGAFYAQSWAMVHMLNMAPGFRENLPRYAALLGEAVPPDRAFREAFSITPEEALARLHAYVSHGSYPVIRVQGGPPDTAAVESSELTPSEAALARVELLLLLSHAAEARKLAATVDPKSPSAQTALGLIALADRQDSSAAAHFREAIAMGATAATPYFELAMLLRDSSATPADYRRLLSEAAGRNPNHAEAHFLLGVEAQKETRHNDAIAAFRSAIAVLPRQSYFWHAYAISLRESNRLPEAARAVRKAVDTARSAHEFEMADTLRRSLAAPPPVAPARKPPVTVPESWSGPTVGARVEGLLEHIDCLGRSARFHVRGPDGVVALWVDNPGDVLLRTQSALTFTFSCGSQQPRRVSIDYRPEPDKARRTQGAVAAIEFR
ncbi:MAG: hypothetical protein R2729_12515 [Bryobacteraceae bacterium]